MQILGLLGMPPRATHPITASPGTGGGSQGLELAGSSRPSLPLPWGSGLKLVLDTVVWGPAGRSQPRHGGHVVWSWQAPPDLPLPCPGAVGSGWSWTWWS